MIEVTDTIEAQARTPRKKGAARKERGAGRVPAVVYGPSAETGFLSLDPKMFTLQRQRFGRSHLYDVRIDGGAPFKAIIKEIQRDSLKRSITHVDLYAVDLTKPIRVSVRVDLKGKPRGAIEGGLLTQILRRIELIGLPGCIPDYIELDVTALGLGQSAHVHDLVLPEGVKPASIRDDVIVSVLEPEAAEAVKTGEIAEVAAGASPDAAAASKNGA